MKPHNRHLWSRLLVALIFGLSLTVALLWLLGGAHLPAAHAGPPARPLFAPLPASTDPISNALNVPLTSNVSITFDEPISLTSVTSDTFAVYGSQSPIFSGIYSLSNLSRTVTLDPARTFFPGERMDATVTTATLNITGEQAISSIVWQFWAAVDEGGGAFVAHPISPTFGAGDSQAVALGDVDGDGDLDAVVANFLAPQNVYLNGGTGGFAAHPSSPAFGAGLSNAVALGDVDGDGDLDAVVANFGQAQDVYLNDGTGGFAAHPSSPIFGLGDSKAVALGDVDGDGDLDAVVANSSLFGSPQDVYLNDGTGGFAAHPISPTFGLGDSYAVALGDVDGDGHLDAVVANWSAAQDVYLNDGTGGFVAHPISPTFGAGSSRDVVLGDLDGDGDLDAVVANRFDQPQDVYLNDGTGRFAAHPISPTFGIGDSKAVALGDVDGDGDLDAVVANWSAAQYVYLNDGTGGFAAHPNSPTFGAGDSTAVALGDVDGDGHLDAVVANDRDEAQTVWLNRNAVNLGLIKSVTPAVPLAPGDAITYTIVYSNAGPETALGVVITDAVPITLTVVGFTSSGAQITETGSVSYTWQVEDLDAGEGGIITITGIVSPSASGTFSLTNRATITTTEADTDLTNNESVVHSRVDTEPPEIVATAPVSGAVDVELAAPVVITFSEAISTSTFSYTVTPDPGGWVESWNSAGTVVTLTHTAFSGGTVYTVIVTAAEDLAGFPLSGAPYAWHFTTGEGYIRIYLPLIVRGYSSGIGESYGDLPVSGGPTNPPAEQHADLNLALRGYESTNAYKGLVDYSGGSDPNAPQLPGLFADNRTPTFSAVYQVYGWDWGDNRRGALITNPEVTLAGLAVTPGEAIHVPDSGYVLSNGYEVVVLYASSERITLKYTPDDHVIQGYTLHVENICVAPNLLALYQSWNEAGRGHLPALRAGQAFGLACGNEIGVAIRDKGAFLDPRSRKDWWQGR